MSELYTLVLFVHLLAFVFWLGADIGVFILGKFAQNPAYTVEQRLLLLQVALIVDKFPRVSMVTAVATGFYLSVTSGWITLPGWLALVCWAVLAAWFVVIVARVLSEQAPHWVELSERIIYYLLLLAFLGVIASATLGTSVVGPSWLFGKLALLAVILVLVLWLEKAFQPAVIGFMTLPETGSTPELERQIKGAMDTTYTSVIGIYACTLGAAFLGLSKYAFG
ncbi:MAG: hypothetical protein AAFQ62_15490 [Pseudomonadota bacterium]